VQEGAGPPFQNPGGAESYDHLGPVQIAAMPETTLIEEGCVG
jgi:hypothetical protein